MSRVSQLFDKPLHEWQVRKLIAGSLQEQHRDLHVEEVLAALVRRPTCGMQWESEERDAVHSRQWRRRLRLRGHAASEGFAARDERKIRREARRLHNSRADGGLGEFGRVRPLRSALHVRKLITQRGDAALRKARPRRRP